MSAGAITNALQGVPFLKLLDIRVEEVRPGHVTLRLPHRADLGNNGGALHTGAIFTLGELAAAVGVATHPDLSSIKHLQKSTKIKYYLPSTKDVTAHVVLGAEDIDKVKNSLSSGGTVLEITVKVLDGHGQDVAELVSRFGFRPN